jgi:hypothetical protein
MAGMPVAYLLAALGILAVAAIDLRAVDDPALIAAGLAPVALLALMAFRHPRQA